MTMVTLGNEVAGAAFGPLGLDDPHRYMLWRKLSEGPSVAFCMLNPSTATHVVIDATIRRCMHYATRWGYGKLYVVNLFAFRATDPKNLPGYHPRAIGEYNMDALAIVSRQVKEIVVGWGTRGIRNDRDEAVLKFLEYHQARVGALKLNRDGTPCHPLYLRKDLKPQPYTLEALKDFRNDRYTAGPKIYEGR